ncbi:MAG: RCC1 domain-containing protein [Myxococcota bacterium]
MTTASYRFTASIAFAIAGVLSACGSSSEAESVGSAAGNLCTGGALVSNISNYSASPGTQVTWTGSANCQFANPEYQFWRQSTGGVWSIVQAWSTSNTYNWDTTGFADGTYNWQVWVREAGSTAAWETYYGRPFQLLTGGPCSSVTSTPTPRNSATVGTTVQISNSANCNTSTATYQIWHLAPGGTWQILQPYSTTATFNWDTTGAPLGNHQFQIWVRAQGLQTAYDAYTGFGFTVTATACTGATISANPASPQAAGTPVTISATAATCSTPTYQFWMMPPGGAWTMVQDFSTTSSYNWDTSSGAAGAYSFQVWIRQQGTTNVSYETYAGLNYSTSGSATGGVSLVTSGGYHSCAIVGTATDCWGYNPNGEVGAATSPIYTPTPVSGLTTTSSIGAGYNHTCVALNDGTAACFGLNSNGQLGNGSTTSSSSPVTVSGLSNVIFVTGGAYHSCALLNDGTARCWGYNSQGQVGNRVAGTNELTPVTVTGLTGAASLSAGYYHSCALMTNGAVRCWGYNANGQLGNGTTTNSLAPVAVSGLSGATAVASSASSNCAILSDTSVRCWGYNADGQLGNGNTNDSSTPVTVTGLTGAVSIAVGPYHSCVALQDGTVSCWGLNTYGELGNGTTTNSTTPVAVTGLTNATSVTVGFHHSCALLADGTAACWGYGGQGELGNGGQTDSAVPVAVTFPP